MAQHKLDLVNTLIKSTFASLNISLTEIRLKAQVPRTILSGILRVVQTKVIVFLKSMSERVGSDIERL